MQDFQSPLSRDLPAEPARVLEAQAYVERLVGGVMASLACF
jgi:hypothetical protein